MTTESTPPTYVRRLGIWDAASIVIGGVIGAGIFRTPATVAERTSAGWQVLLLWAIGGLLTLAGVLCYAELGARRPQAGGTYVYLREAFGKLPAFLFGWTMALINYPGSVAAVATTFADYVCAALGFPGGFVKPVAVGAIGFIVGINLFGIRAGALMQSLFTVLKLAAIMLLVVVGLVLARGHFGTALTIDQVHPVAPACCRPWARTACSSARWAGSIRSAARRRWHWPRWARGRLCLRCPAALVSCSTTPR
jgi:APA family basic amino acid/polyamine antiporter